MNLFPLKRRSAATAEPHPDAVAAPLFTLARVRYVAAIIACTWLALELAPWSFLLPERGLESSWQQVVSHAAAAGWQWGRDVAWLYGPLGFIHYPVVGEAPLAWAFVLNVLLVAALVAGLLAVLRRVPLVWAAAMFALVLVAASLLTGRGIYAALPLVAALLQFQAPGEDRWRIIVPVVIASAVAAIAYVPLLFVAIALFVLADASRVLVRRRPMFVPTFLVAALVAYVAAGQSPANLPAFVHSSAALTFGYTDAMAIAGDAKELDRFLGLSAAALALVLWCQWHRLADPRERAQAGLLLATFVVFWFFAWKSGFVRHDLHSLIAWGSLALILVGYAAIDFPYAGSVGAVATACAIAAIGYAMMGPGGSFGLDQVRLALIERPLLAMRSAAAGVRDPSGWHAELAHSADGARAALRDATPDAQASGSVDLVGWDQAIVLAHGSDYRPQPVFQAFAAYGPSLLDLNAARLRSAEPPGTIFLTTATIDARYPLSDLGTTAATLLARYKPEALSDERLRLGRRDAALAMKTTAVAPRVSAPLGEWIDVPAHDRALVASVDVRPTVGGELLDFAWRLPPTTITVRLANGTEKTHRIVRAVAADGFLLSPYAADLGVIAAQALGRLPANDASRVVALRIDLPAADDRALFEPNASVALSRVEMAAPQDEPVAAELTKVLDRRNVVSRFANSVTDKTQHVEARGTLLFAHAPAAPGIVLTQPATLHVRYGIMEGAWTPPQQTDGACFLINAVAPDGKATTLHEHCLVPLDHEADRAEQEATVRIDTPTPMRLVLETHCRASCSWDWSYWKDIDLEPTLAATTVESGTAMPRREVVSRLAQSVPNEDKHLEARGDLLFAHAHAQPTIELASLHALRVSYGIFSDAWREGRKTDGVCFRITAVPAKGSPQRLHERCLVPTERIDERNEQQFATSLAIAGPLKLVLETDCRANCENDWSYWKDIDIVP